MKFEVTASEGDPAADFTHEITTRVKFNAHETIVNYPLDTQQFVNTNTKSPYSISRSSTSTNWPDNTETFELVANGLPNNYAFKTNEESFELTNTIGEVLDGVSMSWWMIDPAGESVFVTESETVSLQDIAGSQTNMNKWMFYVLTRDNTGYNFYSNGESVSTSSGTYTSNLSVKLKIGSSSTHFLYTDLRAYSWALSASEVLAKFNGCAIPGISAQLTNRYGFNTTSTITLTDHIKDPTGRSIAFKVPAITAAPYPLPASAVTSGTTLSGIDLLDSNNTTEAVPNSPWTIQLANSYKLASVEITTNTETTIAGITTTPVTSGTLLSVQQPNANITNTGATPTTGTHTLKLFFEADATATGGGVAITKVRLYNYSSLSAVTIEPPTGVLWSDNSTGTKSDSTFFDPDEAMVIGTWATPIGAYENSLNNVHIYLGAAALTTNPHVATVTYTGTLTSFDVVFRRRTYMPSLRIECSETGVEIIDPGYTGSFTGSGAAWTGYAGDITPEYKIHNSVISTYTITDTTAQDVTSITIDTTGSTSLGVTNVALKRNINAITIGSLSGNTLSLNHGAQEGSGIISVAANPSTDNIITLSDTTISEHSIITSYDSIGTLPAGIDSASIQSPSSSTENTLDVYWEENTTNTPLIFLSQIKINPEATATKIETKNNGEYFMEGTTGIKTDTTWLTQFTSNEYTTTTEGWFTSGAS
jgi:hypothetical protein